MHPHTKLVIRQPLEETADRVIMEYRFVDATEPYPWPYDGLLDPNRLALIAAGAQEGLAEQCVDHKAVTAAILNTAKAVREAGGLVVLVRHIVPSARWYDANRSGLALDQDERDLIIEAAGLDGFYGSRLDLELRSRGIDQLAFAGFGLETAVHSTLRSANDQGYECITLSDASAPIDQSCGERALHSTTMSGGIFGAIGTSSALRDALARDRH